jgi:hypothetical protein
LPSVPHAPSPMKAVLREHCKSDGITPFQK